MNQQRDLFEQPAAPPPSPEPQPATHTATLLTFPTARRRAVVDDERREAEVEKLARRLNQYDAKRARFFLQGHGQKLFNRLTARGMSDDEASDMADVLEEAVWNRILEMRRQSYVEEGT